MGGRSFRDRRLAAWAAGVTVVIAIAPLRGQTIVDEERPNLLIVVTDDQRFDQMGAAGHPVLETPNMDALAERGVRFENAFVTTSICAASRATLFTGRSERRHGYTFGRPPMGQDVVRDTYFARLHAAGYRTGFVGKWGVRFAEGSARAAHDVWRPLSQPYRVEGERHLTDRVADAAVEFLARHPAGRPFCLSVSFHAPHAQDGHPDQYLPPDDLAGSYADAEVPEPALAETGFEALPPFLQESLGRVRWAWRFDSREKQVRRTRDYWRMISGVDRALGRILDALRTGGFADDTVVVFTSDNGYFLGERGLAGKWLIYERSIRVPFVVVDPRADTEHRGRVLAPMVLNLDLAPTVLALAGLPIPASYEGRSLVPWLRGESPAWREDFRYEHAMDHPLIPKSVGVRGPRWVYARYPEQDPVHEQLFDLEADPDQLTNLASDPAYRDVLEAQRERCDR